MEIIRIETESFPRVNENIAAAIGNFDGLHLGHQQLIAATKSCDLKTAVITFDPHPVAVINKLNYYPQITPLPAKIQILAKMNIDYLFVIVFNEKVMNMSVADFIKNLQRLGIKRIICGYDFSFAFRGLGKPDDLKNVFDVEVISKFLINNTRVSSTYIKELICLGDVLNAKKLLGRPYSINGTVIKGRQIGRKLGFPTANIKYSDYVLPKPGVYAVRVIFDNKEYLGMANIGNNPTLNYTENLSFEVHILDFNQDIYFRDIKILFDKRIRNETKFADSKSLIDQLNKDLNEIREYYRGGNENDETSDSYH